jgi:hypothetical protein
VHHHGNVFFGAVSQEVNEEVSVKIKGTMVITFQDDINVFKNNFNTFLNVCCLMLLSRRWKERIVLCFSLYLSARQHNHFYLLSTLPDMPN